MFDVDKQMKAWIRSHHLICEGSDFMFETVDQTQLDKFEECLKRMGGKIRTVKAVGNWPMGPNRTFKILRAIASVPRPGGEKLVTYWAKKGSKQTRYSDINS
ncbi:phycoerythrin operon regulator [Synechococcus sp. A18-25c]|mgnify:CR=1 FL=1|uniref:CpeR family transcriptional regulator n=1 Tax=unclassified Synechococcus TaxID=2626047 RepID=UPI000C4876E8|nr:MULTISPECIES: CpeR family transcriptional regulator [unclassified Synechococcus]MAN18422.1 CpeR family transcriptional regulator [Synechococcus sp. EAC657]QNI47223.1 phycoerythrin operon regulator [Synechococcus sp. A15-60]QNJ18843.1 phycoerythrin operon regulator [Synechococcus sp. A18-25c]|tara:strand:- start:3298 stop:3603 length:306 start_codon:yes stop_codon:yes gene_type:complete